MATATAAAVQKERRAREYETVYIMRSTVSSEEAEQTATRLREIVEGLSGKMLQVDNWGRRRLAYPVDGSSRGVFVLIRFAGYEDLVRELERNLKLIDPVLRYQTILSNPRVDLSAYEVDPEELQFKALDDATDEEEEPGIAQRLGLVDRPRPSRPPGYEMGSEPPFAGDDEMMHETGEEPEAEVPPEEPTTEEPTTEEPTTEAPANEEDAS